MGKIVKQVIGIDVAQQELVCSLGRMDEAFNIDIVSNKSFSNSSKGFTELVSWAGKVAGQQAAVNYVMEATGVYHEALAYFLADKDVAVSIILPNKISNYFRTLEVRTITDKTMSQTITRFGLERKLHLWKRPKKVYKTLRQLTRERDQLVLMRTMAKNQLHAEQAEAFPNAGSVSRSHKQIALLNKQEQQIRTEIKELLKLEEQVKSQVKLLCSIPGIGELTAAIIVAETNGFDLIANRRQLTSYAGLDVKEKQSGTSVKGKPRISKKGNKYLRKAMHLPALAAIRSDERFKGVYSRLVGKHGIKMKAAVAVQRKLLELCFAIFKNQLPYNKNYLKKLEGNIDASL